MSCFYAGCNNAARYVDERGTLCCALCPIVARVDSVRLSDVPALLALVREFCSLEVKLGAWAARFREVAGRGPQS